MCKHTRLTPNAACWQLEDPETGALYYTLHVQVYCPDCHTHFRFAGHNSPVPANIQAAIETNTGAWVSTAGDELACRVTPFEPGHGILNAPAGSA